MGPAMLLAQPLGLIAQSAPGILAFLVVFLALRPFTREEPRMFRKAIGLRQPPPAEELRRQDVL